MRGILGMAPGHRKGFSPERCSCSRKSVGAMLVTLLVVQLFAAQVMLASEDAADEVAATEASFFFLPEMDGIMQGFVGDCMPYYEDGVYYIYYLKDGGDSYHHAIYLTTTTDFLTYTEVDAPVLEASDPPAQDEWIGTGSVVKTDDGYYLFYTGHTDTDAFEYAETVMLAKGKDLTAFEKVAEWEITPDDSLGQKRDFRDPQGYYDEETGQFTFTITASQDGVARILKYTVSKDLSEIIYDGIIFTDPVGKVYNLECSDTFRIGDTWYLTYSAQDDVLWYAQSQSPYGPYSEPKALDGPLFYAAKHVEDGEHTYMVGWARRSGSEKDTRKVNGWGGNLLVQQVAQREDGSLVLEPVEAIARQYDQSVAIAGGTEASAPASPVDLELTAEAQRTYTQLTTTPERFLLKGSFTYQGEGSFGLAFDFKDGEEDYKRITIDPKEHTLSLQFRGGAVTPAQTPVELTEGETCSFTYIQEDSVGVFYIDGQTAFTVRLYGVNNRPMYLFAENCQVSFSQLEIHTRA